MRRLHQHILRGHVIPETVSPQRAREREEGVEVAEAHLPEILRLGHPSMELRGIHAGAIPVQAAGAQEKLEGPLKLVAAGFGEEIRKAALGAAEFGARPRGDHLDLLDRFDVQLLSVVAGEGVGGAHPVHQRHDAGVPRSMDVRISGAVDVGDARGQAQDILIIAAQNRQPRDELGREGGGGGDGLGVDHPRLSGNADNLLHFGGGAQRHVQRQFLVLAQVQAGELQSGVSGEGDAQRVTVRRGKPREPKAPLGVRDESPLGEG